jgi:hypothetical protein
MNALLMAIVVWLSANFDLPATHVLPQVEYRPAAQIAALRYKGFAAPPFEGNTVSAQDEKQGERQVVAVYDDSNRTIYLPEGWSAGDPANLSVLVHEMVHHLQNVAGEKYSCPQEREELAYNAQQRWLELFGHNLESDFEIDPFTLLLSTKCGH